MKTITIQELLQNRGLDSSKNKIKLVRHKDSRFDLYNDYRFEKEKFYEYQSNQGKDVFHGCDYIVSFIGETGTLSRFIGVFQVLDCKQLKNKEYYYSLQEVSGFEGLKERVIIDWGKSTLSWHQWYDNLKEVVQIHPGLHYKQFTDYFDFILNFAELKEIISKQYSDWKRMLSATNGIYLISDTNTGKLYVGSAYGENGIWGRWTTYVKTNGHGDNKTLKKIIEKDSNYSKFFQFSILMLLPKTITADEAIKMEKLFKTKLGTNSFGLNNN